MESPESPSLAEKSFLLPPGAISNVDSYSSSHPLCFSFVFHCTYSVMAEDYRHSRCSSHSEKKKKPLNCDDHSWKTVINLHYATFPMHRETLYHHVLHILVFNHLSANISKSTLLRQLHVSALAVGHGAILMGSRQILFI